MLQEEQGVCSIKH